MNKHGVNSILIVLLCISMFSFHQEETPTTSTRELLMLTPTEFFAHPSAQLQISEANPYDNLLTVSVFQATNLLRERKGLPLLKPNYELHMAGEDHIGAMREYKFFGHTNKFNKEKKTPRKRVEFFGGEFTIIAENLALVYPYNIEKGIYKYKYSNGDYDYFDINNRPIECYTYAEMGISVVRDWYYSSSHRQNLLNSEFTHLGIATQIIREEEPNLAQVYAVQNFGAK